MSEQSSDIDDNHLRKCTDDTNDADLMPPVRKTTSRRRHRPSVIRRIQHPWKHEEIAALIAAVEKRRCLWDVGSEEYKLSKLDSWREVYEELGSKIDAKELKLKWSSLRVTFKVNLENYRKKKLGQGPEETCTVSWRYFKPMLFLTTGSRSTSTKKLSSAVVTTGQSVSKNLPLPPEPTTTSPVAVVTQHKQRQVTAATPTPSESPSSNFSYSVIPNHKVTVDIPDRNVAFCNYLLAELTALSSAKALDLRRGLSQTLWNFLDNNHDEQVNQLIANAHHFAPPVLEHIDNTDAVDVKMNIF